MIRLSIISTLYKTAAYLPRCIDSLLNQDIPSDEYEIILINDGSPENDLEIAKSYASQYHNIKVVSHPNKGLAGARNTGLSIATGQYLCFVDPDDYILPNSFECLLNQMDDEHLDMLRFDYHVVNPLYYYSDKPKSKYQELMQKSYQQQMSRPSVNNFNSNQDFLLRIKDKYENKNNK